MRWSSKNLGNADSLSGANVDFLIPRSGGVEAINNVRQVMGTCML